MRQHREERQAAVLSQDDFVARLEFQAAARSERRCTSDAERLRRAEDEEDNEELYGMKIELSFEAQLAIEHGWL